MADTYVPTTDEVARAYCDWDRTSFDAWLVAQKAAAWNEGYQARINGPDDNPYEEA